MSQQNSRTPSNFIRAVEAKFKVKFIFDLACTVDDCVVQENLQDGRGYFFDLGIDALKQDWSKIHIPVLPNDVEACGWLNNPWKLTNKFAKKCSENPSMLLLDEMEIADNTSARTCIRILSLFTAGVGSNWFAKYVHGQADVYFLHPRITYLDPRTGLPFVQKYPKGHAKAGLPKGRLNSETGLVEHIPQTGWNDAILCDWAGTGETFCWDWQQTLSTLTASDSVSVQDALNRV